MPLKSFFSVAVALTAALCLLSSSLSAQSDNPETLQTNLAPSKRSRLVVSVDGGLGYLLGSTKTAKQQMKSYGISESEANRYYRKMKLGEQAGASVYYFVTPDYAFGLDYNLFTTGGEVLGYLDPGDGWSKYYGAFKEKIYTNFFGISAFQNQRLNEKWNMYAKFSLGMATYRNESELIVVPMLVTGKAPAIKGEFGFSYNLSEKIRINAGLSYLFSSLRKIKVDDGTNLTEVELDADTKENLSRLNLSTGLQFTF